MRNLIIFIVVSALLGSCKKAEDRSCYKSAGEENDSLISVSDFSKLYLSEHIDYELIQDSLNTIEIIGGKNLIPFINVEKLEDGTLQIKNENKCNFLRYNANTVKVKIHFSNINYITYKGTKDLISKDTLKLTDLQFFMVDGGGSAHLKIDVSNVLIAHISHGSGDFNFEGKASKANLNIMTLGSCDTRKLNISNAISIVSNSNSPCFINSNNCSLKAEISGQGNVYYRGQPTSLLLHRVGQGDLIME